MEWLLDKQKHNNQVEKYILKESQVSILLVHYLRKFDGQVPSVQGATAVMTGTVGSKNRSILEHLETPLQVANAYPKIESERKSLQCF